MLDLHYKRFIKRLNMIFIPVFIVLIYIAIISYLAYLVSF